MVIFSLLYVPPRTTSSFFGKCQYVVGITNIYVANPLINKHVGIFDFSL